MIRVENLTVTAGTFQLVDVSFTIPTGCYGLLMGRTGSGKTTLLECVTGLKTIDSGRIILGDTDVSTLRPAERNIGYVPQDGALFPTMTVAQHLAFALNIRRIPAQQVAQRVDQLSDMLEIGYLLDRYPANLSGGEQQRVALGRALSFGPSTLCLDEPLSALDEATRMQIIELLKRVQREMGVTCLHVTHSHIEAELLADVQIELLDGQIVVTKQPSSNGCTDAQLSSATESKPASP